MQRAKNWVLLASFAAISSLALWIPTGLTRIYENFDGPYYLVVAKTWYNKTQISTQFSFPLAAEYYTAHFPLYPVLITGISTITGLTSPTSMVLINVLGAIAGSIIFYTIAEKLKIKYPFFLALAWLFIWPRMWVVRSVGSPETLFIVWTMLSLYLYSVKRYWPAGLMGALAVLTKSPGILLFVAYAGWFVWEYFKNKKLRWEIWPTLLIPLALVGLFAFYYSATGDFLAYFHSGDNIHLQLMPFKVFDSSQPWVGDWWLEDAIWIYLISGLGVWAAFKKYPVWGIFGAVFLATLIFVSHRDLERYSLPLVPVVLLGLAQLFERKEFRWALVLLIIPLYFYSLNFISHNTVSIADWGPLL
jgi:hypothetical protein